MTPIIEVVDLKHVYSPGTPFEHKGLDGVSFRVERGQTVGIIGHTGSGKSTLIQHLNGLLKPTSGKVYLDGTYILKDKQTTRNARFRVGLVLQYPEYQLFEETVRADISFGPKNMGLSDAEVKKRVEAAAACVGLTEALMEKSPFDLSGGQKRRVAIAGVLAMEPEVLILDEPTAGLDPKGRADILENLKVYQRQKNATLMIVSHSMEEIASFADQLLVLQKGRVAMYDTPAEVFKKAAALQEMGLAVPQITQVFLRLKELGVDIDTDVYTTGYGLKTILAKKEGAGHA
ncbi:MAG: energy-coupling factor transporter ATPase [Clostridia bacterium]|nr:energy-coupling factor transporter ATPase [Clostridia bacterium]